MGWNGVGSGVQVARSDVHSGARVSKSRFCAPELIGKLPRSRRSFKASFVGLTNGRRRDVRPHMPCGYALTRNRPHGLPPWPLAARAQQSAFHF